MMMENGITYQQIDVLIVDDVPENLSLLTEILKKQNYNIRLATDAKIALRSIKAKLPMIILLDVQLPGMDGFELCKILKADDLTKDIPVIFLTVHSTTTNIIKGFEAGGVDYITKPILAEEVLVRINTHIKFRKLQLEDRQLNNNLIDEIEKHKLAKENLEHNEKQINELLVQEKRNAKALLNILKDQKESLERFQLANQATFNTIWDWNLQSNNIWWNKNFQTMFGYMPGEMEPGIDSRTNRIHPEDLERIISGIHNVINSNQQTWSDEYRFRKNDGNYAVVADRAFISRDNDGNALRMIGAIEDITYRKIMDDALRKSEENLSITLNSIGDGVISTDRDGLVQTMNPVAEKLCGWEKTDAIGKPLTEIFRIINSDTRKTIADPVELILEKGEIVGLANHTILISKNGNEYQIANSAAPIRNKDGIITGVVLVFSDVTDKYAAQESIAISEIRYRRLFETAQDGILILNATNGLIIDVNPYLIKLLGYSHEMFLGKTIWNIGLFKDIIANKENFLELQKEKYIRYENLPLETSDGRSIWVEFVSNVYTVNHYDVIQCNIRDITERKLNEEKIIKLSQAVEQSPVSVLITDKNGNIEYTNPKVTEITGYQFEELRGKNPRIFKSGEKQKSEYKNLWDTISTGKEWFGEFHNKKKNGELYWEYASISPIYNEKGKITHYVAIKEDITERKREELIRNVIFNISNAVITTLNVEQLISLIQKELEVIIDTTNFFLALYDAQTDTFSLPFFKDEYDNFKVLPAENTVTRYVIKTQKSLLADKNSLINLEKLGLIKRYGKDSLIWLGVPLKIDGEVIGALVIQSYDDENAYNESDQMILEFICDQISIVIQRKKVEEELVKAKEKAQESDRLKSAFLANMSHEIRTPMNGILGFAELLKEPDLTGEQQQKYIGIIQKSGARMLNIINDIVDISKIDSGLMQANIGKSNINEQIEFIYTFFKPEVDNKGIELFFKNTLPANEANINTDREKLFAILTNLVKNAIKYTNTGVIEFGYEKKEQFLEFYIKDTGIGVPIYRQQAIFERFIQADIEDKMARQGAGLGLAITKSYVEMLGGKIWVESEEGIGSCFYFTLPYNTDQVNKNIKENIVPTVTENHTKKLKILIAEDDETSEILIELMVNVIAKEVLKARTGLEAIDICRNNPDINLVLMDIQMPVMGGYEATRQIRQFNKDIIIIAQTAFGLHGDREKSLVAGCNDYIRKPIGRLELTSLIHKHCK